MMTTTMKLAMERQIEQGHIRWPWVPRRYLMVLLSGETRTELAMGLLIERGHIRWPWAPRRYLMALSSGELRTELSMVQSSTLAMHSRLSVEPRSAVEQCFGGVRGNPRAQLQ